MNGIFAKIILIFIGLVFFGVLIFSSFSSSVNNKTILPRFGDPEIGEYTNSLVGSGESVKSKIDFNQGYSGTGEVFFEKNTDIFTSIYSDSIDYSVNEQVGKVDITIGSGTYIVNSRTPFKSVYINVGEYEVLLEKGGVLYIENTGTKALVASLNSTAEVTFIQEGSKEKGINLYLYPHMYLGFKINRLKQKSELDSLRLSQLATLGYFPESFSNILKGNFGKLVKNQNFLTQVLKHISVKKKSNELFLKNNIPNKVDKISGIEYVEKYFALFYNERKKLVYHQNKVLEKIIELLKINEVNIELVGEITESLETIKQIDIKKYNEILQLINNFSLLAFDTANNDVLVLNYSLLTQKIHGYSDDLMDDFSKDFDRLNLSGKKTFYKKLQTSYSKSLNGDEIMIDYYLYFVRNVILHGFEDETLGEEDFNILIDIFNQYSANLNITTIDIDLDSLARTREITNIVYNERILKAIKLALVSRYFGERDSQGLLTRTQQKIININGFQQAINHLEKYYAAGKILLNTNISKYEKTINSYKILSQNFEEYFFALKNYSQYQKKYSDLGIAIDGITVIDDGEDDGLSKAKFIQYMKQFNGIDLNSVDLEIEQDGYMVNKISIEGNIFTLFLNPYRGNRIMDISRKNTSFDLSSKEGIFYSQLSNTTYEMDDEQIKYEKLLEKAKDENIEKLDFKNFFKNNFFPQESVTKLSCEDDLNCKGRDTEVQEEDEVIQLFKTATLLGDKGEFRSIKKILDVKYSNLIVTKKKDTNFNITIEGSKLSVLILKDRKTKLTLADFDSDYRLEGGHYFYNIKLRPFEISSQGEIDYVFGDIPLYIKGNVSISNFEDSMKKILMEVDNIESQYKAHISNSTGKVSQIHYSSKSQIVTFE